MTIQDFTTQLHRENGIYFAKKINDISYPQEGNDMCYQIEENSFWFTHRNNCITEVVKRFSPNRLFFDIGGGNGYVAKGLEENGVATVLVEPGIAGVLNAQKRGLKNIVCATLEGAKFKPETLPSVGLFDVVEHIEDDLEFLKVINSSLDSDGLIYLTVPAFNFLWSNEDVDAGHFRRYTLNDIGQKLTKAGFKIEFASYIFSILPFPVFMFRTVPSYLGLNKNSGDWNKHQKAHAQGKGFVDRILESIWAKELNTLRKNKRIPIGGSCLVVARKNKSLPA